MKFNFYFILMYASFFLYSLSSVFSKLAALQNPLSLIYFCYIFAIFIIMALYAVLWQLILKQISLSVALANKPIALVCSLFWAVFFFNEKLTIKMIIGIIFIVSGIIFIGIDSRSLGKNE